MIIPFDYLNHGRGLWTSNVKSGWRMKIKEPASKVGLIFESISWFFDIDVIKPGLMSMDVSWVLKV